MKGKISTAAALALVLSGRASVRATIYGADDRLDVSAVRDEGVRRLADSTVALFQTDPMHIRFDPATRKVRLFLGSYGVSQNLCREEPFFDEPGTAGCSGALVAPDVVMTAGHCVMSEFACRSTAFVFGFVKVPSEDGLDDWRVTPPSEIYGCAGILAREFDPDRLEGPDWALVRLDRTVPNHAPLALADGAGPSKGTPLFYIGNPGGIYTKVVGGAQVRDDSPQAYFTANLDSYDSSSGAAVFNAKTGLIEGILVRGEDASDYVSRDGAPNGCRVSAKCPDDGCRGSSVTRIGLVLPHLPRTPRVQPETSRAPKNLPAVIEKAAAQAARFD